MTHKTKGEAGGVGKCDCDSPGQKCHEGMDIELAALKSENAALREALGESCPHGCSDGKCPWDRRVAAARRALKGEK